jgi:transcriptional regulator with XRE-family HTH domain
MTPARLAHCLAALRWSQRGLAAAIGYDDRLIRRWAAGERPIPAHVAAWLERAATWHGKNPPPR